jgi:hypothetical protein
MLAVNRHLLSIIHQPGNVMCIPGAKCPELFTSAQ